MQPGYAELATVLAGATGAVQKSEAMSGAESWLEQAVRDHSRLAYRVAFAVLRNAADAEDAVQDTFLKVLRAGTNNVEDCAGWIARVSYRSAVDIARRRKHEDLDEFELVDSAESQDEALSREQEVRRLRRMITGLPEELRHLLELSALGELNSRQVAETLGINEGTVRTRLMRARQLLREKLEAAGQGR